MTADTVTMLDSNGESITGINITLTNNSKDNFIKITNLNKFSKEFKYFSLDKLSKSAREFK